MPSGWAKPAPLTVAIVFQLVASTTLTSLERMFVTQTSRPSGVKATYQGQVPTVTVRVRRGCGGAARADTSHVSHTRGRGAGGLPPGGGGECTRAGGTTATPVRTHAPAPSTRAGGLAACARS